MARLKRQGRRALLTTTAAAAAAAISIGQARGATAAFVTCLPAIQISWPAMGSAVAANTTSAYTRLEVAYTIVYPCRATDPPRLPHGPWYPRLEDCVMSFRERHSVNPGTIDLEAGAPIFIIATEPGTYAFELSLSARGGASDDPPLASTAVVFDFVRNYSAEAVPSIGAAFDAGANVYRDNGAAIPGALPRAQPLDLPRHAVPHNPPPWTDGIPYFPYAPAASPLAQQQPTAYWDRLPRYLRDAIAPMRLGVVGGLAGVFDGTKQFLVQYETTADGRLLDFTHMDMMSERDAALVSPAGVALTAANVSLVFDRVVLQLDDYDGPTDFLQAGARMARVGAWCQLSDRMRRALTPLSASLATLDALWRVNYDAGEEYLQQVARLAAPALLRLNDLVGRVDMPCRTLRGVPPSGDGGGDSGGGAVRDASAVPSGCVAAVAAANEFAPGWLPDLDLTRVAYLTRQYDAEVAPLYRRPDASPAAMQAALRALDARYDAARDDVTALPPQHRDGARDVWQPQSYESLVAPSHFVAQLPSTTAMARPVIVIPGLNARRVTLAPRDDAELTVVGPDREAAAERARACSVVWGGWVPPEAVSNDPLPSLAARSLAATPPLTVAFIGRVVREKGVGLFIATVAALLKGNATLATAAQQGRLRFVAIGGAPAPRYLTLLERAATAAGVRSAIHFVGFQPPAMLQQWYRHRCLDAVLAPYIRPLSESFGLVLVEAMEAEVPVVHLGVGGIQDYARDGANSVVAACASGTCLADALAPVLASAAYRRALGTTAAAHARAAFRTDDVANFMAARLRRAGAATALLTGAISGTFRDLPPLSTESAADMCDGAAAPLVWADAVARVERLATSTADGATQRHFTCGPPVPFPRASDATSADGNRLVSTPSVAATLARGSVRVAPTVTAAVVAADGGNASITVRLGLQLGVQLSAEHAAVDGVLALALSRKYADVLCGYAEPHAAQHGPLPCPAAVVRATLATLAYEQAHTVGAICIAAADGSHEVQQVCTHVMDLLPAEPAVAADDGSADVLPFATLTLPPTALPLILRSADAASFATVSLMDARLPYPVLAATDCTAQ